MDTDYLTKMAYKCIWLAQEATDVLRIELGAACSKFKTEDDYLHGILGLVREIEENPVEYLDDWNLLEEVDIKVFRKRLEKLREYIIKTINTSLKDRGKTAC